MEQKLKEVFKDFNGNEVLLDSIITSINLYKKTNKLELRIKAISKITLDELECFERYLKHRFSIENVVVKIEYDEEMQFNIEEEWDNIVEYMGKTHPISKAFLKKSSVTIENNEIKVSLFVKGSDILKARGIDKIIVSLISDVYGKKVKIALEDKLLEESIKEHEKAIKNAEAEAINNARIEAEKIAREIQIQKKEEIRQKQEKKLKEDTIAGGDVPLPNEPEEETPLIYGRNINIKEEHVKVADISVDTDKVCLDGEIVSTDSREIKNGKVIVMFDLYDGTSTITCKAFVEGEQAKKVLSRIQGAKGIRLGGVAKYDQFSKEITVMANTIVETQGRKKVKREDNSEEKRVELHMHTQMSQMDGMTATSDLLKRAVSWGWKSIAITDHGVVQAFPDAHKFLGKSGADLKVIYGVEA